MLYLIGLGLADPDDITVKGFEIIKHCNKIYLESYTSKLSCSKQELEEFYGKEITLADRDFVESADEILAEAKSQHVALLIIGDPLCATTHWDILQRAKENNIKTSVIHNASIINAVGATGLQVYKFGKTTSIPFPQEGFEPESFYNVLRENKSIGAHTLFLLDLDPLSDRFLTVNQALEILMRIDSKRKENAFSLDDWCVAVSRLGFKNQKIVYGTISEVVKADLGPGPNALIIPGSLHFVEEEALQLFKIS